MNKLLNARIEKEIGYQTIFWLALFIFGTARNYSESGESEFREFFYYGLCHLIFQIAGSNFIYYVLMRKYFDHKKYILFSVYLLSATYVLGVLNRIFIVHLAEPFFANYPKNSIIEIVTDIEYLLICYIIPFLSGAFIFISVMYILRYNSEKQNTVQLQKEKAELELNALKSQLNPHFLFNTLNNIYSLSIVNSSYTSESISRLSDILDYVLYKGQQRLVMISDELSIIDAYIELEKLRYDERLHITQFENIKFTNLVPPLLYLSLVENAFKHGAEKTSGNIDIRISVVTGHDHSIFKVENSVFKKDSGKREKTGIGLKNIEKQLQSYYPDQYSMKITDKSNWFAIEIIIPGNHD
nr:histidine kinase [uncultured Pedobacter sp.]